MMSHRLKLGMNGDLSLIFTEESEPRASLFCLFICLETEDMSLKMCFSCFPIFRNPSAATQCPNKVCRDPGQRIQNLNFLVQQIRSYYLVIPAQMVEILREGSSSDRFPFPFSAEQSLEEMKNLLLLLMGCAVQCEKKEEYIERIQTLDFDTKAAIAGHIQELTHSQENVLDLQWLGSSGVHPEEMESAMRNMAAHLQHIQDQRDTHLETIVELMLEKEGAVSLLSSPSSPQPASHFPSMQQQAGTQQHLAVELADSKAKIRRLRQELEVMCLTFIQNSQLQVDARAARTYRDELDALRERAIKADKLESEVGRYKEQLHKMEFYKAKVEELKEDNRVLQETKEVLEDQLEGWRSRTDQIHQLEKHNLLLKARVHDMEQEKEADAKRMKELQEENLALCLAQRRSMEESQHLGWELEQLSKTADNSHGERKWEHEEVSEKTRSQILKLEKENQRLLRTIEELRAAAHSSCRKAKLSPQWMVCNANHFTSSAEQSETNAFSGDSRCQQQLITEELEAGQSRILLTGYPDCHAQENGHLQDQDKEMVSDLETMENNHNQLHCCVGSCGHSPGSQKRKVQRLEAEVQELEAENQALQASLEELRISARRLEQLETEKQNLEHETSTLEKDKRQLEKENRRLRQQAEIQEANLDSRNVCMASLEREMRLLVKEAEGLRETSERVKSLERDNRELIKQAAIDQKTLATLREELVSEKLKTQQRDNELETLSHELEMKVLNQENAQLEAADKSELESSLKKSLQIKDDKMAALEARLQESSSLNQQILQELKTVSEVKRFRSLFRRLFLLKNATLEAERQAAQVQLKQLESQSDSQQAQILALQRQAASLQESNTALQTHNANLQVEKSTLNSQSASLMAQNAHLQQQQSGIESERDVAIQEREELRGAHEQLLRDHERLTALHERQAMECEALLGKHACLKNAHRTLELEHRTLQDRHGSLQTKLEEREKTLKEEQMRISLEKEQHQTTAAECCRLRDEKDRLNRTYRLLLSDNEALTVDHKLLKSQLNEANLKYTWLEADFSKLKKEDQELDINFTKLTNQCELLSQLKGNLEEENRHLIGQIETLMLQNRSLLEQNIESKDLFHVEERQYIDKLNDLRRQKEKLEEKIMDQYKFYDPSPPPQSESSGELSLSLENEPWSNGSSPVQQPPSRNSSCSYLPPSDVSTPQPHSKLQQSREKAATMPTPSSLNADMLQRQKDPVLSQDFWLTRGTRTIRRGSRKKVSRRSSDSGSAGKTSSELDGVSSKDEKAQASACSPITVLYVQGKSSSMSGCLNCFSAPLVKEAQLGEFRSPKSLPRTRSVISPAEGSSRRSSVSGDCRATVQTEQQEQAQEQNSDVRNIEPGPVPPVKPPRDPAVIVPTKHHKSILQEPPLGSSFTFNSVFSDTIFSDSEITATILDTIDMSTNFLGPNPLAEQNSPPERGENAEETPQTRLGSGNEQSETAEEARGLTVED
uniref:HOOK N-terminal domain-containing protein n=1 Tax=Poecilia mexicana TaxID=48701 RepID=A0A3B3XJT5_9TELE